MKQMAAIKRTVRHRAGVLAPAEARVRMCSGSLRVSKAKRQFPIATALGLGPTLCLRPAGLAVPV